MKKIHPSAPSCQGEKTAVKRPQEAEEPQYAARPAKYIKTEKEDGPPPPGWLNKAAMNEGVTPMPGKGGARPTVVRRGSTSPPPPQVTSRPATPSPETDGGAGPMNGASTSGW